MMHFIGVSGGTASGKTSVCEKIIQELGDDITNICTFSMDSFYKPLDTRQQIDATNSNYNFDHPDAFDWNLLKQVMHNLSRRKTVNIPIYDFTTHSRIEGEFETISGALINVIILEGILTFYDPMVADFFHIKLFVDTDADTRLARRVMRDINTRGRTLESVLNQYEKFVKPAFDNFILPTKKYADVIIPRGVSNTVAIEVIVEHIRRILDDNN